ncbi:MAG TPA: circadian clock KaiB family protein [Candidatus Krumholzibacteria bacterium]
MAHQRHRTGGERRPGQEAGGGSRRYVLRLYVAGLTARSATAIRNVREICETHLHDRYDLEVIDLHDHPTLAREQQVIAAPTLIKELPAPLRRLIGDMTDRERVLVGLNLRPADAPTHKDKE